MSRRSDLAVIAHGAIALLRSGQLADMLAEADERHLPVISEHGLLRRLGLLPATAPEPRPHGLDELAAQAGLSRANARLLALFDIVEDQDGRYSFRDLKAARDFARRLDRHRDLTANLEAALAARRRHAFRRHLAEVPLRAAADEAQATLDLGDSAEGFDETWSLAVDAQSGQDYIAAETLFRRCAAMRPRDALCLTRLAAVLVELDRPEDARELLRRALAIKPDLAEAWLDLSRLEQGAAARTCLERAIAADPACIEAVYDLALIHMEDNAYDRALPLWEHYMELAPTSASPLADRATMERARRALMLCRMARLQTRANGAPNQ
jgi:tetratricopeptide (TPR) repeat protein